MLGVGGLEVFVVGGMVVFEEELSGGVMVVEGLRLVIAGRFARFVVAVGIAVALVEGLARLGL